ncbi:MAG: YlxR family protein [Bacillota bacterium]|nr:YlxR family protein [Bacillota bacterium]
MDLSKKIPQRRCLGCMVSKDKHKLIRIVKTSGGNIFHDITGKIEGRGAYVCKDAECLAKARKANRFAKALSAAISDEIYMKLEEEIKRNDG